MSAKNIRLVLKSGNVFDSLTGKVNKDFTIIIEGNIIKWVGKDNSFDKQKRDKIIDVSEKFVYNYHLSQQ